MDAKKRHKIANRKFQTANPKSQIPNTKFQFPINNYFSFVLIRVIRGSNNFSIVSPLWGSKLGCSSFPGLRPGLPKLECFALLRQQFIAFTFCISIGFLDLHKMALFHISEL